MSIAKIIIWIVIFYFFYITLYKAYLELNFNELSINYYYLLISFVLFIVFVIYRWLLWRRLVPKVIPIPNSIYYHTTTAVTKYLPWKVWVILTKVLYLKKYNIDTHRSLVISIYENIFQLSAASIVSLLILNIDNISKYVKNIYVLLWIWLLWVFWTLIVLKPKTFLCTINFILRSLKRKILVKEDLYTSGELLKKILLYIPWSIINGLAFYFLVLTVFPGANNNMLQIIWIRNFASIVWLLAFFTPWWIWVREWILTLLLQLIIPIEFAVLVSVLSRVWTVLWDWLLYIVWLLLNMIWWENLINTKDIKNQSDE